MTFWILAGLLAILALAIVAWPMLRSTGKARWLPVAVLVLLPVAAFLIYRQVGSFSPAAQMPPQAPSDVAASMPAGAMPPGHPSTDVMNMDLNKLADQLAEKLRSKPDNPEGWALLARTYVELKRHRDALPAFERASSLLSNDPALLADYADAIAMSAGGKFDRKTELLVEQALAIDPQHVKSLMLKATIEFNRGQYARAIDAWERLLKVPGLDAETIKVTQGSIAESRHLMTAGDAAARTK